MKARTFLNISIVVFSCISLFGNYGLVQADEKKLEIIELDPLPDSNNQSKEISLEMTPDVFIKKFNTSVDRFFSMSSIDPQYKKLKSFYTIKGKEIKQGSVNNVLNAKSGMNKHYVMSAINKKTGKLKDVSVMINQNSDEISQETIASDYLIVCRVIVSTLSSIPVQDSMGIVSRLMTKSANEQGKHIEETVGNMEFSMMSDPIIGAMFIAKPIEQ